MEAPGEAVNDWWCSQVPDPLQEGSCWPTKEGIPLPDCPCLKIIIIKTSMFHFPFEFVWPGNKLLCVSLVD